MSKATEILKKLKESKTNKEKINEDFIKDVKKIIDDSTKIYILLDTIGGIVEDQKIVKIILKAARDLEKIEKG